MTRDLKLQTSAYHLTTCVAYKKSVRKANLPQNRLPYYDANWESQFYPQMSVLCLESENRPGFLPELMYRVDLVIATLRLLTRRVTLEKTYREKETRRERKDRRKRDQKDRYKVFLFASRKLTE